MIELSEFQPAAYVVCLALLVEILRHTLFFYKISFFDYKEGQLPTLSKKDLDALLESSETVVAEADLIRTTVPLMLAALSTILWFELYNMVFYHVVISSVALFFPYMQKCSKYYPYCSNGIYYRSWHHHFMTSSLVYLGGGIAAIIGRYQYITFLCFMTVLGSLLYHRHREGQFFNLDNIFASSKLVLCLYVLTHAMDNWPEFAVLGVVACPVVTSMFVVCGDPSEIMQVSPSDPSAFALGPLCCVRNERNIYLIWHSIWHVLSGMGPVLAVIYFHFFPFGDLHPYLDHMAPYASQEECLLIWALGLAVATNILLNLVSIAPMV